jgi:hypothetical protein
MGARVKKGEDHREYIGELTAELAKMARIERMDLLARLLEMAAFEAKSAGKKFNDACCG